MSIRLPTFSSYYYNTVIATYSNGGHSGTGSNLLLMPLLTFWTICSLAEPQYGTAASVTISHSTTPYDLKHITTSKVIRQKAASPPHKNRLIVCSLNTFRLICASLVPAPSKHVIFLGITADVRCHWSKRDAAAVRQLRTA